MQHLLPLVDQHGNGGGKIAQKYNEISTQINSNWKQPGILLKSNYFLLFRYHELSEKEILDHLVHQQRYDKRERPPSEGKINIRIQIYTKFTQIFSQR